MYSEKCSIRVLFEQELKKTHTKQTRFHLLEKETGLTPQQEQHGQKHNVGKCMLDLPDFDSFAFSEEVRMGT